MAAPAQPPLRRPSAPLRHPSADHDLQVMIDAISRRSAHDHGDLGASRKAAASVAGLRARTSAGSVGLSAFTQSTGYLIAMVGPLAVGVLYEATGGWVASLGVLLVALVIQATAGLAAARPCTLEDETGGAPATCRSTELSASTQV